MSSQTLELLRWISERPRTYAETLSVWRSNCPQHAVWEDALADGLVVLVRDGSRTAVALTPSGRAALEVDEPAHTWHEVVTRT
jgi:hypothetical protein